jgi:hypothetical protein
MFDLQINNPVFEPWSEAARNRAIGVLAFLPVDFTRVELSLSVVNRSGGSAAAYLCKLRALERSGFRHVVNCHDVDAYQALERALVSVSSVVIRSRRRNAQQSAPRTAA